MLRGDRSFLALEDRQLALARREQLFLLQPKSGIDDDRSDTVDNHVEGLPIAHPSSGSTEHR